MGLASVAIAVLFSLTLSQAPSAEVEVAITEGRLRAAVIASATPNVTGGTSAAIPARPLEGRSSTDCEWFRIRAWVEGEGVRVVVFAVNRLPEGDQEAQVATYFLKPGQSVDVAETKRYGARPVYLRATALGSE